MQKRLDLQKNLSSTEKQGKTKTKEENAKAWEEYSSFHDSFTELLSYENSRKSNSDFWLLNYV